MSTIIGIDPGKSGGIAVIKSYGNERLPDVWADKMPETPADILGYFDSLLVGATAFIEQVNAAGDPNFRGVLARAKLYGNYCSVEMALLAAKISCEPVTAAKWQKAMGCSRPGMPYADKKRFNKERAQQLFPRLKVTLDIADALLIAEYGRRARNGLKYGDKDGILISRRTFMMLPLEERRRIMEEQAIELAAAGYGEEE